MKTRHHVNSRRLIIPIVISICIATLIQSAYSQSIERERPAEWNGLIFGGRFIDRIETMYDGKKGNNVWGTKEVQGRFVDNGIESPDISFWGGNILKGNDGKYHIFVAGWREDSPKGHMSWWNSTVFHATSECIHGPFQIVNTVGRGHNPEAYVLDDGRIIVYVIDGYYIADDINSLKWTYGVFDFEPRDRRIIEGLSNLSFARRQDGSRLMVCRGGGIWISKDGISQYEQITCERVYPNVDGRFEDPVVWRDSLQYHLIVNDWYGRIAFYERSMDGVHWVIEPGEAYTPGIARHSDGTSEGWYKYERLKVFQDQFGRACQVNFAVIDTLKNEDKCKDRHSSKNICIPLNPGLMIEILNKDTITSATTEIKLIIKAETGFIPYKDLDIESLRLGSYNEVNFGRGSKPLKHYEKGKDLIVVFEGENSKIAKDEWAPKLIGKRRDGGMVYGYAKLPYVDYRPAILSARCPVFDSLTGTLSIKVKNYGLKPSIETDIAVFSDNGDKAAEGTLKSLASYEECTISFPYTKNYDTSKWIVKIGCNEEKFQVAKHKAK